MKNKTIILGKSGSGKSYKALNMALKNKGTTIICNGDTKLSTYLENFPKLNEFEAKDGEHVFNIEDNGKYFIEAARYASIRHYSPKFLISCIRGNDHGFIGNDKKAMAIFDDGAWTNDIEDKIQTLWELSHYKCGIIITCNDFKDLLHIKPSNEQIKDIKRAWNIIFME